MKTALLLTNSAPTHRLFTEVLAQHTNLVLLPAPAETSREKFDATFAPWLRLADAVILDAASLGDVARAGIEALAAARAEPRPAVVVRVTQQQRAALTLPADWLVTGAGDTADQLRESLGSFFELREAKTKLHHADAVLARQRPHNPGPPPSPAQVPAAATPGFDSYRHRQALRGVSRVLGESRDEATLLRELSRLLCEWLGVARIAIFTRPFANDLFGHLAPAGHFCAFATGIGIAPSVSAHLRLALDAGIGHIVSSEARILRRDRHAPDADPQIQREFELLGADVVVPMFDNDALFGVVAFSGRITGEPITNDELELVYHLLAEVAQAVRSLHLQAQVAAQQRFMSEVLAHVSSGVIVAGADGRIVNMNARAVELLGGQVPAAVMDVLREASLTGEEVHQREIALPDNGRPLSVSAARFEATGGGRTTVAVIEDLTQLKAQAQHARAVADQEFFTRLSARLSHELKNSLVSIKIFAQLLPERFSDREFREQFSNVVVNQVNRVDALVNNLTFFGQPLTLVCEELALEELIEQCIVNLRDEFGRKQLAHIINVGEKAPEGGPAIPVVQVRREFAHHGGRVEGDKIRLQQAFDHIIRNAVQSMPQGGRLSIATRDAQLPAGEAVRIEWADTGEGIAAENLRRVTEPFVTTRNIGVGLGLTIVKKIIERHGGRLTVEGAPGRGATMVTTLPLHVLPAPAEDGASAVAEDSAVKRR